MKLPFFCKILNLISKNLNSCPGSGIVFDSYKTNLATVFAFWSGRDQFSDLFKSLMVTEPSIIKDPSGCGFTPLT